MQKTSKTDITEEIKGESTYKNRSLRNVLPLILSHISSRTDWRFQAKN